MLLAGDIGGTKTALAVVDPQRGPRSPLVESTYPSADFSNLESIVGHFLDGREYALKAAVFGVAGPVVEGRSITTNLPWDLDERNLSRALGLKKVHLINDLEAIAYSVPHLTSEDLVTLNEGRPEREGALAVIAPGTGLGEAFLIWNGKGYRAHPSEGGHSDFSPGSALELELLRHLQVRHGHVSWEQVCSGIGIPNIYTFLRDGGYAEEPAWLAEEIGRSEDPNPIIISRGIKGGEDCPLCRMTLETFVSILGREAGNLALKVMATGGVFLGGGIPPRILPALEKDSFLQAFRNKGRMAPMMDRIPVRVIVTPGAALLGAACYGLERIGV